MATSDDVLQVNFRKSKSRPCAAAPTCGIHEDCPLWDSPFVELLTDCAFVQIDGYIVTINSAGVRQLGASSADEIIGRSIFDFIHPDHHASTHKRIALIADGRSLGNFTESVRLRLDGSEYLAEVSSKSCVYNGKSAAIVIVHDITARRKNSQQLSEARSLLSDAADNVSDGLALFDQNACLIFSNNKFLRDEPAREEIVKPGTTFEKFVRDRLNRNPFVSADELEQEVARRLKWFTAAEGAHELQDGSGRWFLATHRRTRSGNTVIIHTDITARKHTEAELVRAKEAAETASRTKTDFLANMSHELRTPLNAVIGFADVITKEIFGPIGNERYRDYADDILQAGTHLLELISDILDLAKVEADRMELEEKAIDISGLLAKCEMLVSGRAAAASVRLCIHASPGLPLLLADELRVKQIILNLLSNAVKFSPEGDEVSASADQRTDGGIDIVVRDHGRGMTEGELKLAVLPFRQVGGDIAKSNEGVGLGLPLSIRLANLHGAEIVFESALGKGTSARVAFPATRTVGKLLSG